MRQPGGLREVVVINLERWRDRRIEHREFVAQHFDLAAFEGVVGRALWAGTHQPFDLHAKLVADLFSNLEHVGAVWITHHLHITFAVAQIDKDHATVVAAPVDPAAQSHGFAQQGFSHKTAIVRTHSHRLLSERYPG